MTLLHFISKIYVAIVWQQVLQAQSLPAGVINNPQASQLTTGVIIICSGGSAERSLRFPEEVSECQIGVTKADSSASYFSELYSLFQYFGKSHALSEKIDYSGFTQN